MIRRKLARLFATITACLKPVLPLFTAAAILKMLIILLSYTGLFSLYPDTEELLTAISNACFYFLPVFTAYASACHFGTHRIYAMASAVSLLLPDFIDLMNRQEEIHFLFIPVYKGSYAYSVLPVIVLVYIMSRLIGLLERVPSNVFQNFFVPMITITLTALTGMLIVGPLGSVLGNGAYSFIIALQNISPMLSWAVFAALTPLLLITGTHWVFVPMILESLNTTGIDVGYMVGFFICNASLAGTCLASYFCDRKKSDQSATLSAGLVIMLSGVAEPALFGVCIPKKIPLVATILGCFIGGLYQGIFTPVCTLYSFAALPTILMFHQPDNPANILHAIIAAVIGFAATFILTCASARFMIYAHKAKRPLYNHNPFYH